MPRSKSYYTLIGSLPALPAHFEQAQRVPISRIRLDERLKMLDQEHALVIRQAGDFLLWERQRLDRTYEEVVEHYEELMARVNNRLLREVISSSMNTRTIMGGLRRKRKELGPAPGSGKVAQHIARNWKQADFRLGGRFPWIGEAARLLDGEDPFELDRFLLNVGWNICLRLAAEYSSAPFSFEALILYLVRWETIYRWTNRDAAAGQQKFEELATQAMGQYAQMYGEEPSGSSGDDS